MTTHEYDPRGLIRESYRIDGIGPPECRTIFLDWALGAAEAPATHVQIAALLATYGQETPDHPMSVVLREGLEKYDVPAKRRGGHKGRVT